MSGQKKRVNTKERPGLLGKKIGMTQLFMENGEAIPVTVIEFKNNAVTQIKQASTDGYSAIQVCAGEAKNSRVNSPQAGLYKKVGVSAAARLKEFRVSEQALDSYTQGQVLTVESFVEGQLVDVSGRSKGKGFAGGVKRWNFRTQDNSHGNSLSHRAPGSIGQCQTPGRVFKGKKMAGQLGFAKVTVQSLAVVRIDVERNLIMLKGAVPGANGNDLIVRPAVKACA